METTKRKWSIQTAHTRSIGARLPNDLYERLKTFCAQHGYTTTEAVCDSLERFMNDFEDDGKETGAIFCIDDGIKNNSPGTAIPKEFGKMDGAPSGARTLGTLIKSQGA